VYADDGTPYPPHLGHISRLAYQDSFHIFGGLNSRQPAPTFATFTEAVDYLRANQAQVSA
jgi:hypothetical protein